MAAASVEAVGWDPHFAREAPRYEPKIVNLGFPLNVIEDPAERVVVLKEASALASCLLFVSVMIVGAVRVDGLCQFGDRYLTARATFQKYFQQAELKAMLTQVTGSSRSPFALERGRLPHTDEVPAGVHDLLAAERVSFARAIEASQDTGIDAELFADAAAERRNDLLVHQALNILNRSRTAARSSPAMVRDIRQHFGSQQQFGEQALEYPRAPAEPQRTVTAVQRASDAGLGAIDEDGRLVIDSECVAEPEGVLRCYVGCAPYLSGDIEQEHIVRLDPMRRHTTLFPLTGRRQPFPETKTSITIDLKRQDVIVRDDPRILVRKADVFGMARRSRQRSIEGEHRSVTGIEVAKVLVRG